MAEYLIKGFASDEEHMLGYFLCQPVDAKTEQPVKVAFAGSNKSFKVYFDLELLDYVLTIDENEIDTPYKPPYPPLDF